MKDDDHRDAVVRACGLLEGEFDGVESVARAVGMSRFHFQRVFKVRTGLTPGEYAKGCRAERVRKALGAQGSVTEAIYEAGYGTSGRFYDEAAGLLGMQPKRYRAWGRGELIRFAVGECSLGSVLVGSSERGVCALLLGNDPAGLVEDFENRFREAELVGGNAEYEGVVAKVVGYLEEVDGDFDLPLDLRGTVFQQRVWKALREIGCGETVSYSELAERVGVPKGARAVAGACAANPLAVVIPCHRVVRTGGGISGYRWGVERKRMLLKRELEMR